MQSKFREVPATLREQKLQGELETLKQRILQYEQAAGVASSAPSNNANKATKSALLEFLADAETSVSQLQHYLSSFPLDLNEPAKAALARQCWEHLLEGVDSEVTMQLCLSKIKVLVAYRLFCPSLVWKQYHQLEHIQILITIFCSQRLTGQFLGAIFDGMHPELKESFLGNKKAIQRLYCKLDTANCLRVAVVLAQHGVLPLSAKEQIFLTAIHLSRHGPLKQLTRLFDQSQEGELPSINDRHNGFPLLFQPLIELESGWLQRLRVLLEAGADASALYQPWNCSALHMLLYRKSNSQQRKICEDDLVQATCLLLEGGAKYCLNAQDTGGRSGGVSQRTALIQAASAGRLQVCRVLLQAGADFDLNDSNNQTVLDYLFYLKHSHLALHQRASAGYTCMQLSSLIQNFRMQALITDELAEDCRRCGRCRFLLAPLRDSSSESSSSDFASSDESDTSESDTEAEMSQDGLDEGLTAVKHNELDTQGQPLLLSLCQAVAAASSHFTSVKDVANCMADA